MTTMEKEIVKITYTPSYRCFGIGDELSYEYVSLTKDKIVYVKESQGRNTLTNPRVEISYDPNIPTKLFYNSYKNDFERFCEILNNIKCDSQFSTYVCDAIPDQFEIEYTDGTKTKIEISSIVDKKAIGEIMFYIRKHVPYIFHKDEEDEEEDEE